MLVVGWLALRTFFSGSEEITIRFADAHGLKAKNTDVEYLGTQIGHVTKLTLNEAGNAVDVTVSIDRSATRFLKSGTRFYLRGAQPSLSDPESLGALISGPTIIMEPGSGSGRKTTHFIGFTAKPVKPAQNSPAALYAVLLSGEAGALKEGDPVKLYGFTVGEVRDIGFEFNVQTGAVDIPCTLAFYPVLFHLGSRAASESTATVRTEMSALIERGLHARLARAPPLVGSYLINLELLPGNHGSMTQTVNGLPQIPFTAGGGVGSTVARVNKIPIEQITDNILAITRHIDALVSSPEIKTSVAELAAALQQIHQTTAQAGPRLTELLTTLHKASDDLDHTAKSTDQLISGTATQEGLNSVTTEITEAARAARSLANYLDQHPEALVRGR